jgi:hypothetical protein
MRTEDLEIEKNLNKTMIVQTSTTGTGQRGAGFYVSILFERLLGVRTRIG